MQITVEEISPCRKKLNIAVPVEEATAAYQEVLSEYTKHAKVDGFRPGKAPDKVIRLRFGKQIKQEVKDRLIPQAYRTAVQENSLQPVAVLEVDDSDFKANHAFTLAITCDVAPDFELPDYATLSVNSTATEVTEADVDTEIEQMMDRFASFDDVERPIQADDLVQVDFDATLDGAPIEGLSEGNEGLGTARDFWVHAGEHAFLPEFGEGLIGASVGDAIELSVTFPDEFGEALLQGKTASYAVTIKVVREKNLPALNEEHLKAMGVETEEALREQVREGVESVRARTDERDMRNQIVTHLLQKTEFDLPESVVQDETRNTIYEMVSDITRRGAPQEEIEQRKEELFDAASRSAGDKVKVRYILARIASEESITATEAEVQQRIMMMAYQQQMQPDAFRAELQKRGQLDNLSLDIQFEKTLDYLLKQANVVQSAS